MATNVDKAVYASPQGISALDEPPEIEIEVVPDDAAAGVQADGSMIVDLSGGEQDSPGDDKFEENLAELLDDSELTVLASDLDFHVDNDRRGRADWEKTYQHGLKLLGLKLEERTEPWDGACGIVHPMITEAVVRFQAETTTETFPASGPVKTKIIGRETKAKKEAAERVTADMNWELTENMPEFRGEHERMLWELPAVGSSFKKVYYDEALGRQVSTFVSAEDVLLPYGTSDLSTAHRITHVLRKTKDELVRDMEAGFYKEYDLDDVPPRQTDEIKQAKDAETGFTDINDERYVIHEVHANLVIKGDRLREADSKIAYPYVVTYIKDATSRVLAVRRNWREEDPKRVRRQHFVHYQYVPGFGSYGYGLFHLIGGYAQGSTSILRQLVDAGTLANLPGGLKTRGLRIKGDDTPIGPGEFRDVDIGSGTIKDNIMPLPYKEPSVVLAGLLEKIIEDGRRFAATADMQISDMSAQAPVGTTLAILERQLKVLTAVQARTHYSLKQELKLLKEIIRDYTPDQYDYDPATGVRSAKRSDYNLVEVIPVSDPNASTLSQRVVQHQAAIQMAGMAPEIYDLPQLHREMLEVLGFKNAAKIVPLPEDHKPCDPITENMNFLRGKPVKAFLYQDHLAHISAHRAAMQDPMIMQVMGQNPKAPQIMAAATAHLAEHMGYLHRQQVEAQLGMTLPPEGESLSPQVESALSSMMAQAAQRVLEQNQAMAAAAAQQQMANDPLVQLQMQELAVKKEEAATKRMKVTLDAAAKADELRIRETEVEGKLQAEGIRMSVDMQKTTATMAANAEQQGMKLGVDIGKAKHDAQIKEKDAEHKRRLAEADQAHRHTMEDAANELAGKKFDADTAHKAHQVLSSEGLAREKMGFEKDRAQRDDDFRREDATRRQQFDEKKLSAEEKRAAQQAKMKQSAGANSPAAKKTPAKRPTPKK